jgi:hypothetical protein
MEITVTKRKKGRAQSGATRTSRLTVNWRGQAHQVTLPHARINQGDFERELRAQVPGMAEARYEIPLETGKNYWAQGSEITVRELSEGEEPTRKGRGRPRNGEAETAMEQEQPKRETNRTAE